MYVVQFEPRDTLSATLQPPFLFKAKIFLRIPYIKSNFLRTFKERWVATLNNEKVSTFVFNEVVKTLTFEFDQSVITF